MNIYFVNKNAVFNGPFDIKDSNNKRFISIGDVCLLERDDDVAFLYIVSEKNTWKACRCFGETIEKFQIEGNTLLLSFDSRICRKGNLELLRQLLAIVNDDLLLRFIRNAIDILTYNEDQWDLAIVLDLYHRMHDYTEHVSGTAHKTRLSQVGFVDYFEDEVKQIYHELFQTDMTPRNIFITIRRKYPQQFRKAMKAFLIDNPNSSIYD